MDLFRRSIVGKLMVIFFLVGVFSLSIIGIYAYYNAKRAILQRTLDQLTSIRVMRKSQVLFFFKERTRALDLISRSASVKDAVGFLDEQLLKGNGLKTLNLSRQKISFDSLTFGYGPVYYIPIRQIGSNTVYQLTDTAWNLVSDPVVIQKLITLDNEVAGTGKSCITDFYLRSRADTLPSCFLGSPVYAKQGRIMGTLALGISITEINNIMLDKSRENGLGTSGESYLVGRDFLMRSNSRFIPNSVLKTKVNTLSIKNAFADKTGSAIIDDYRTVPVLSSYSRLDLPGLDWAVVAELDYNEAMIPINSIRNDLVLIAIIISILIFSIAHLISRSISQPIIKLKNATTRIAKGEFGIRVDSHTLDEIGVLSGAFNDMAIQLETERNSRMTALYDGQEIERQRISRELHDGLGQMLVAMKIKFENSISMENPGRMANLAELREDFTRIIGEVRKVSYDLAPAGFTEFGLDKAMKLLCSELSKHGGIEIEYASFGKFENVSPKVRNYLFRITQEGLNNAIRHSNAGKIHVQLTETGGTLILMLEDNGRGFEPGTHSGNGLYNMKERARLLGGTFDLETAPGKGTTIRVKIPESHGTET